MIIKEIESVDKNLLPGHTKKKNDIKKMSSILLTIYTKLLFKKGKKIKTLK